MWRDVDPREHDRDARTLSRGSRAGSPEKAERGSTIEPREALTRDLNLPRGPSRERIRVNGHEYDLRGTEVRTLAAAGTFRVVPASDLREQYSNGRMQERDLANLRRQGLIRTTPYVVGRTRTTLVTLTDRGREVLGKSRRARGDEPGQAFYSGISKPRELAHDTRLHRAYQQAAERLGERGARVRRVVLEEELKRDYQRFLQEPNRGRRDATGRPDRSADEIERWARERHLPHADGHVEIPDVRLEYEERDGRRGIEDVEVTTPHYRGAHAAAKARSGFKCYRGVGARVGGGRFGLSGGARRGGRGLDPRAAEEFLQ
jgi:hypothetical protein